MRTHSGYRIGMALAVGMVIGEAQGQGYDYKPAELEIAAGVNIEEVRDAGNEAIAEVVESFVSKMEGASPKRFALLPLQKDIDGGYFTAKFQTIFADKGSTASFKLFTRENETIAKLIDEIGWGKDFGDVMDRQTVQKFGGIQGVEAVIVPRITISTIDGVTTIRAILKGNEVESFAELRGGGEAKRVILPPEEPPPPPPGKSLLERFMPIIVVAGALVGLLVIIIVLRWIYASSRPR